MTSELKNGITILTPAAGKISQENSTLFKKDLLAEGNKIPSKLAFNFGDVETIDSSGLGALISFYKTIKNTEDLVIFNLNDKVKTLFDLTRLSRIFHVLDTEKDVMNYFSVLDEEEFDE